MFVSDLRLDAHTQSPILLLQDEGSSITLPIIIGITEASAVAAVREGIELPRPLVHDLLVSVLKASGCQLKAVEITRIHDSVFYANLQLLQPSGNVALIDARPSDAIAIAVRVNVPIWVREDVLAAAGVLAPPSKQETLRLYLEGLEADEFGPYKQ